MGEVNHLQQAVCWAVGDWTSRRSRWKLHEMKHTYDMSPRRMKDETWHKLTQTQPSIFLLHFTAFWRRIIMKRLWFVFQSLVCFLSRADPCGRCTFWGLNPTSQVCVRVASRLSMFRDKPGQLAYQTLALMLGDIFPKKTSFIFFSIETYRTIGIWM